MSDMAEVKTLLEAQGKAWEEFKTANDARHRPHRHVPRPCGGP